ncbi:adenosine deaminase 2-like [Choristoneura fumiferana]|uniref:adenosine deaminase 2-like n=1 Tax=Choristoneura fumiferana TaxID=7141 RepID=UPI003D154371
MQHKLKETNFAFDNPEYFNFTYHFFKYKADIYTSKVYKIIKDLPKGAALHLHDVGILGPDYLMNITYMSYLYVCFVNDTVQLMFSDHFPNNACSGHWQLMSEARRLSRNVTIFDAELRKHFTLVVNDPAKVYPSIKNSWGAFSHYFNTIGPMLSYRPVREKYLYDALKAFREEKIMYVEVRSSLHKLYELNGTTYDPIITAKIYEKYIKKFMKDYPDFIGAKLIYTPYRKIDKKLLAEHLELALKIKGEMPDVFFFLKA